MAKTVKLHAGKRTVRLFSLLILSLLATALLLGQFPVDAESLNARISSEDQTIHRGQTFEVDVNVSDNTGLLTLFLTVNPGLRYPGLSDRGRDAERGDRDHSPGAAGYGGTDSRSAGTDAGSHQETGRADERDRERSPLWDRCA